MSLSESLTIRILGDSSSLRRELDQVGEQIEDLQTRLSQVSRTGDRIGQSLAGVSLAMRPLQQVSQMLSRIAQQVQTLSQTPVTLNVQPALNSLQQLLEVVRATAAAFQSTWGAAFPAAPQAPPFTGPAPGPRRMGGGGLVTGPAGLDRVPAMLSAGEFVLSQAAVDNWGTAFLDAVNSRSRLPLAPPSAAAAWASAPAALAPVGLLPSGTQISTPTEAPRTSFTAATETNLPPERRSKPLPPIPEIHTTNNHFGGITIQVRETADVNAIVRDLRLQRTQLRNRRG